MVAVFLMNAKTDRNLAAERFSCYYLKIGILLQCPCWIVKIIRIFIIFAKYNKYIIKKSILFIYGIKQNLCRRYLE